MRGYDTCGCGGVFLRVADRRSKKEREREGVRGEEGRKEKGKKEKKTVCASLDKSVHPGVRRAW